MLHRTLQCVATLDAVRQLWLTSPGIDHATEALAESLGFSCHRQRGETLGSRMQAALAATLAEHSSAVLIGSDSPVLSAGDIEEARSLLKDRRTDVVITPAEDGGYVLIGMRQAYPALFAAGIGWGGDGVMAETRARLVELDLRWRELATRWDVDRPEDLERLAALTA